MGKAPTPDWSPAEQAHEKELSLKEEKEESKAVEENENEDDDIFNTEFVNETLAVLDVKLAEIPDSPDEPDDDIFDTKYADVIVEKHEKEKKVRQQVEANKIKFGCISAAADVLTGKV